jgi:hypothetical protein
MKKLFTFSQSHIGKQRALCQRQWIRLIDITHIFDSVKGIGIVFFDNGNDLAANPQANAT